MSAVATAIVVGGIGGSLIAGNAASHSQASANATNAQIAAQTNQANWNQYLLSRGINPGGLPGVSSGNVNTVLPLGFTLNGQPAEQAILNRILQVGGFSTGTDAVGNAVNYATAPTFGSNDEAYQALLPAFRAAGSPGADGLEDGSNEWNDAFNEWTTKLQAASGATNWSGIKPALLNLPTDQLNHVADLAASGGQDAVNAFLNPPSTSISTSTSSIGLPPQYQRLLDYGPQTLDQLYGGNFLGQQQSAQDAINAQRTALAGTVQQGIDEQRTLFGNLNTGQLSDLDRILSTNTASSGGIYDAAMLQADTYSNAVKQATSDELQRQRAARALSGFVGEGSGDSLLRARTLASGYQAAGNARAQAGVDQAGRLYDINNNDVTQRFNVNSSYLQALTQLLNANGAAANAQAGVQNATDNAAVLNNDISARLGNLGAAGSLITQRYGIDQTAANSRYDDLNSLLGTLGFFRQNQPATPGTVTPQIGSVLSPGQSLGAGISAASSGLASYYQNQQLVNALRGMGGGGGSGGSTGAGVLGGAPF